MEEWLLEVPGLKLDVAKQAQELFSGHSVGAPLLDFLSSEDGLRILEAWRSRGSRQSQSTGAEKPQAAAPKANRGRQRISAAERRLGGHYFSAAERPPARSKDKEHVERPSTAESLRGPFYAQAREGPSPEGVKEEGPKKEDRLMGALKSFCEDTGYGFIHCEKLSQDVFLASAERPEDGRLEPGRLVEFTLAYDSQRRPKAKEASWHAPAEVPRRRFFGRVKSVGSSYGFIDCARTYKLYARDVYFSIAQLPVKDLEPSQLVSFDVVINGRGQPQAKSLACEDQDAEEGSDAGCSREEGGAIGPVEPSPVKKHW